MSRLLEIGGAFPYMRMHKKNPQPWDPVELIDREWVFLPDGRVGVVDHIKRDGTLAVRPINKDTIAYFPNIAQHWSIEDRWRIPEEIAIRREEVRPVAKHEMPGALR